ncbi:iron complex transport system permease protein [Faunimonas pinastri]|uniref:Iron complex transport system permease protein n=1 Tax=Faunimonas pinastri TaxID=1855383 RepID=A0A1H9K2X8_9HYPH|nr:Fe(3+)-hydroxamate ABC transporter permease FhuB [Faunimonas pinastri]SEQ93472.1 iron complex transport system permease protein [Faunimonas pinastri]
MAEVRRLFRRPGAVLALAVVLGAGLTLLAAFRLMGSDRPPAINGLLLYQSLLPRAAVAIAAGASLALSGALFQRVLRNPIAEPSTLGIASGVQLALGLATVYAPALMATSREWVGLGGGFGAFLLVLALTSRGGFNPVSVVLSGMLVSLTAGALGAALILANGDYMMSLFIWGGGSLIQDSWAPTLTILARLGIAGVASALLLRPLAILALDESSARSLGVGVAAMRFLVLVVAVWLAVGVSVEVGLIGFVGLAAPALARALGARSQKAVLLTSPVLGGLILWVTDGLVQASGSDVPTGAVTALLGGPLLLWLLPRLTRPRPLEPEAPVAAPRMRPGKAALIVGAALVLAAALGLLLGKGPDGWSLALGSHLAEFAAWRLPRIVIAATSGAMLAAAGVLLQRITANPLASPEVLGIATGSGLGLAAVLLTVTAPSRELQLLGAVVGAGVTLLAILAIAVRGHYGPERLLLGGIAVSSLGGSVITVLIATGKPEAFQLLGWFSGSTNAVLPRDAVISAVAACLLLPPLFVFGRWLSILPLGPATGSALGLNAGRASLWLVLFAALLTGAAAVFVGPLSFVGLMAPHLARHAGFRRPREQLAGAVLIGATLLVIADWLARMLTFPYQLPLGLFASLIGGPYLVWLLRRGVGRN